MDEMVNEYQDLQKKIKELEGEMEEQLFELSYIEGSKIDLTNNAARRKFSMEGKLSAKNKYVIHFQEFHILKLKYP